VPPSPTPRAVINMPIGSSNIDNIIDQGTLTIGWIAAFAWGTWVFEWLWSLATWLFSGRGEAGGGVSQVKSGLTAGVNRARLEQAR